MLFRSSINSFPIGIHLRNECDTTCVASPVGCQQLGGRDLRLEQKEDLTGPPPVNTLPYFDHSFPNGTELLVTVYNCLNREDTATFEIQISEFPDVTSSDLCDTVQPLSLGETHRSNFRTNQVFPETLEANNITVCPGRFNRPSGGDPALIFSYIANSTAELIISAVGTSFDTVLISIYTGTCGAFDPCYQLRSSNLAKVSGLVPGKEIFIVLQGQGVVDVQVHAGPFTGLSVKADSAPLMINGQVGIFSNFSQRFYTALEMGFGRVRFDTRPTFFRYRLENAYPELRITLAGADNVAMKIYTFDSNGQLVLVDSTNQFYGSGLDVEQVYLTYYKTLIRSTRKLDRGQELLIVAAVYNDTSSFAPYQVLIQEVPTDYYYEMEGGPKPLPIPSSIPILHMERLTGSTPGKKFLKDSGLPLCPLQFPLDPVQLFHFTRTDLNSTLLFSTCDNIRHCGQTVLTVYGKLNGQLVCLASDNSACLRQAEVHLFGPELDPNIITLYIAVQAVNCFGVDLQDNPSTGNLFFGFPNDHGYSEQYSLFAEELDPAGRDPLLRPMTSNKPLPLFIDPFRFPFIDLPECAEMNPLLPAEYGYYQTKIASSEIIFSTCELGTDLDTYMTVWRRVSGVWECFLSEFSDGCSILYSPELFPVGTEFMVAAKSVSGKAGRVELRVQEKTPPAPNAQCSTSQTLVEGQVTPGRTTGSITNARMLPSCDGLNHNSPAVFFNFTVPGQRQGQVIVTTDLPGFPPSFDTVLWLYSGNCGNLTCVIEQDDNLPRRGSNLTYSGTFDSDTELTLVVLGYDVGEGEFSVLLQSLPSGSSSKTPSLSPSISITPSVTTTVTATSSVTPSISASVTASLSFGASPSATNSDSVTVSQSETPSLSRVASSSPTGSISITDSSTPTASLSEGASFSSTNSISATLSLSETSSLSVGASPSTTNSISTTPPPTETSSLSLGASPSASNSDSATGSRSETPSLSIGASPSKSFSGTPSLSVGASRSPTSAPSLFVSKSSTESLSTTPIPSPAASPIAETTSLLAELALECPACDFFQVILRPENITKIDPFIYTLTTPSGQVVATLAIPSDLSNQPNTTLVISYSPNVPRNFSNSNLGGSILDIHLVDSVGEFITQLDAPLIICLNRPDRPVKNKNACLSFYDEATKKWKCEDECLHFRDQNDQLCGETDHLTNFALLLAGASGKNSANNNPCSSSSLDNTLAWVSLGMVAGAILIVALSVVVIEVRARWNVHRLNSTISQKMKAGSGV